MKLLVLVLADTDDMDLPEGMESAEDIRKLLLEDLQADIDADEIKVAIYFGDTAEGLFTTTTASVPQ